MKFGVQYTQLYMAICIMECAIVKESICDTQLQRHGSLKLHHLSPTQTSCYGYRA
jgi:hypothetical protein